jgi:hypothetical protein
MENVAKNLLGSFSLNISLPGYFLNVRKAEVGLLNIYLGLVQGNKV